MRRGNIVEYHPSVCEYKKAEEQLTCSVKNPEELTRSIAVSLNESTREPSNKIVRFKRSKGATVDITCGDSSGELYDYHLSDETTGSDGLKQRKCDKGSPKVAKFVKTQ